MVGVLWSQGGFAMAELLAWPLPAPVRWAQVAFEAPAAVLMLWLAWRWGLMQSLRIRLLAMLHAGFLWLGLSLALAAVSHAMLALSGDAQAFYKVPHAVEAFPGWQTSDASQQPEQVRTRAGAEHWVANVYLRQISPYLTRILLRTPITGRQLVSRDTVAGRKRARWEAKNGTYGF